MARDSKIEKKNENRGIGVKWNLWGPMNRLSLAISVWSLLRIENL